MWKLIIIEKSHRYRYSYYVYASSWNDADKLSSIADKLSLDVHVKKIAEDDSCNLFTNDVRRIDLARVIGRGKMIVYGGALPHLVSVLSRENVKFVIRDLPRVDFKRGGRRGYWLRTYQFEAIQSWSRNMFLGTVVLPTGSGKTLIGVEAIRIAGSGVVVVPTIELAYQWRDAIISNLGIDKDRVGIVGGGHSEWRDIVVITYHSANRNEDKLADYTDLLILDEAHRVPAKLFRKAILKCRARMRLGLSPSLYRDDGNEHLVEALAGRVVYSKRYSELARLGFLAPLSYRLYTGYLDRDEERQLMEAIYSVDDYGSRNVEHVVSITYEIEVVKSARWKLSAVKSIVSKELDDNPERRIFIFSDFYNSKYSQQAREIYEALSSGLGLGGRVEIIHDKLGRRKRREILDGFKRGDVNVVVASRVLDEGIDVPDADVAIIASTSASVRQFIQRIGRVVRPKPRKVARVYDLVTLGTRDHKHAITRLSMALPVYDLEDMKRAYDLLERRKIKLPEPEYGNVWEEI